LHSVDAPLLTLYADIIHCILQHHSNILPWVESLADVITISEDVNEGNAVVVCPSFSVTAPLTPCTRGYLASSGGPDTKELEALLLQHAARKRKIGSFSAGSNITGITIASDRMDGMLVEVIRAL